MGWLSLTAWEHGMDHVQEERYAQGLSFMAAALRLMDFSEYSKDHKEVTSFTIFKLLKLLWICCFCKEVVGTGWTYGRAARGLEMQELV